MHVGVCVWLDGVETVQESVLAAGETKEVPHQKLWIKMFVSERRPSFDMGESRPTPPTLSCPPFSSPSPCPADRFLPRIVPPSGNCFSKSLMVTLSWSSHPNAPLHCSVPRSASRFTTDASKNVGGSLALLMLNFMLCNQTKT